MDSCESHSLAHNALAYTTDQNRNHKLSQNVLNILPYPPNALSTLIGEVNLLLTALRRNSRWASHTVLQVLLCYLKISHSNCIAIIFLNLILFYSFNRLSFLSKLFPHLRS